jgi:hypothetical protein
MNMNENIDLKKRYWLELGFLGSIHWVVLLRVFDGKIRIDFLMTTKEEETMRPPWCEPSFGCASSIL